MILSHQVLIRSINTYTFPQAVEKKKDKAVEKKKGRFPHRPVWQPVKSAGGSFVCLPL